MKAIELVCRAQPMVEALREIAITETENGFEAGIKVAEDCDKWLNAARGLLNSESMSM